MNVWSPIMNRPTNCSGMKKPLSPYTETYPANHHKACGGRLKQTFGYKRQVLKKRRPATRARDDTPRMASRSMGSMGNVNTNNKKAQRTICGLVLARTRIYITFLGRVEGRVVSRRRPVSVCRITEESCVRGVCQKFSLVIRREITQCYTVRISAITRRQRGTRAGAVPSLFGLPALTGIAQTAHRSIPLYPAAIHAIRFPPPTASGRQANVVPECRTLVSSSTRHFC